MEDFWDAYRRISLSISEPMMRHARLTLKAGGVTLDDEVIRTLYAAMRVQALIEAGDAAPSSGWNEDAEQISKDEGRP